MQCLLGNASHNYSSIELDDAADTDDMLLGMMKTTAQSYIDFAKGHGAAILGDDPQVLADGITKVKEQISQAEGGIKNTSIRPKTLVEITKAKDTQDRV